MPKFKFCRRYDVLLPFCIHSSCRSGRFSAAATENTNNHERKKNRTEPKTWMYNMWAVCSCSCELHGCAALAVVIFNRKAQFCHKTPPFGPVDFMRQCSGSSILITIQNDVGNFNMLVVWMPCRLNEWKILGAWNIFIYEELWYMDGLYACALHVAMSFSRLCH